MYTFVAGKAQCYQVLGVVGSAVAPVLDVVKVKMLNGATDLALMIIPFQDILENVSIRLRYIRWHDAPHL